MMDYHDIINDEKSEPDAKDVLYTAYGTIVEDTALFLKGMMKKIDENPEYYANFDVGDFLNDFRHDYCGK